MAMFGHPFLLKILRYSIREPAPAEPDNRLPGIEYFSAAGLMKLDHQRVISL
jgi:hypothetical protein